MRWVRQEETNGCTVACFAMVLGISYREARVIMWPVDGEPSFCFRDLHLHLADHGYAVAVRYRWISPGNRKRLDWPCQPWADLHHVNLLYGEGAPCSHAVLMLADGSILDPLHEERRSIKDYARIEMMAAITKLPPAGSWNP